MPDSKGRIRRREFIHAAAGGIAAAGLLPRSAGAQSNSNSSEPKGAAEKVRVGYIGVGGRGTTHLRTMLEIPGAEIAAVCDIDPTALERAARLVADSRGGSRPASVEDYRRVLDAKDVDAVLSALPCDLHARVYLDVIAAGKDLYAEKPMCLTVAESDSLVKAAEASGFVFQVGFQRRYSPRMQEGIRRIHAGEVGELIEMRASFLAEFGPLRGWFSRRARSGDWMVEQAVHVFDVMNWVFKATPVRAFGAGRRDLFTDTEPDRDVTDYYSAIIEYPGNVIVSFIHSWLCPRGGPFSKHVCQVLGRKGAVDLYEGKLNFLDKTLPAGSIPDDTVNTTRIEQESFLECVRKRKAGGKAEPLSGVRNGRDSVLAGLLVRKAVDERRFVTWEEMLKSS